MLAAFVERHDMRVTQLRDVLTRLPNMTNRQIPEVTPEAWAKAQRASAATAAKTS